jgi:hypothetical protein
MSITVTDKGIILDGAEFRSWAYLESAEDDLLKTLGSHRQKRCVEVSLDVRNQRLQVIAPFMTQPRLSAYVAETAERHPKVHWDASDRSWPGTPAGLLMCAQPDRLVRFNELMRAR